MGAVSSAPRQVIVEQQLESVRNKGSSVASLLFLGMEIISRPRGSAIERRILDRFRTHDLDRLSRNRGTALTGKYVHSV